MSTIAYRDGVMVSDSAVFAGDSFFGETQKIFKIADHKTRLVFTAGLVGDLYACRKMLDWLTSYYTDLEPVEAEVQPTDPVEALVVFKDGSASVWDSNCVEYDVKMDFYAIGNGRDLAIGAMAAGATALEAVGIACEFDAHTKGPLQVVDTTRAEEE